LLVVGVIGIVGCADADPSTGVSLETTMVSATASLPPSSAAPSTEPVASSVAPSTALPSTTMPPAFDPYELAAMATPAIGQVSEAWVDTPDGRQRHYRLYVPTTLRAGEPAPLLVALHGGLGTSEQFALNSGFDELAESNGFVVVYPDGIRAVADRPGLQTWNGGYCCGPAARDEVDDVGYIRFLIDLVSAQLPVDPSRVFAAGHSNGAILAYRLACELSDRIVAIGVQAGSLGVDTCRPGAPVSVLHLHGLADTNHPIDGGVGTGVSGVEFRSARDAVRTMASVAGCGSDPLVELVASNPDVEVSTWSGCSANTTVRLLAVTGASHAWMGHAAASPAAAALVGEPYMGLDASRAIWSFLAAHPRG